MLRQIEKAQGEAQDATRDLIDDLEPKLVLVIGIAGALPTDRRRRPTTTDRRQRNPTTTTATATSDRLAVEVRGCGDVVLRPITFAFSRSALTEAPRRVARASSLTDDLLEATVTARHGAVPKRHGQGGAIRIVIAILGEVWRPTQVGSDQPDWIRSTAAIGSTPGRHLCEKVEYIASLVGFRSTASFTTRFRAAVGESPSAFRVLRTHRRTS